MCYDLGMDSFSETVINTLWTVPPIMRAIALFLFSFSEGVPVLGSILPGGTIAILAGSLSVSGLIAPVAAFLLISVGSFLGDMTGFLLGKRFKHLKWIKAIVESEKHQKTWDLFDRHIALIAIFGKLIPVVRSTPSIFAAARGVRTRRYAVYSFIGSALWGFAGVYGGNLFTRYFGSQTIPLLVALIVLSIVVVGLRYGFKAIMKARKARTLLPLDK